ncbi:hypothetical protein CN292_21225 [Bacillus cereus]|nr:hypothetical protein CN534_05040 [Bacillus cereus]PEZ62087.1 hypothetical protein CN370_09395 [Bacillus cereus]PFB67155.1 hypothetical protein CN292_21225 [Bacillus cereus]
MIKERAAYTRSFFAFIYMKCVRKGHVTRLSKHNRKFYHVYVRSEGPTRVIQSVRGKRHKKIYGKAGIFFTFERSG